MKPKITLNDISSFLGLTKAGLIKQLKKKEISHSITSNKAFLTHSQCRKLLGLTFPKQIIAVQIVKGGSGKTSITHSLGVRSSLYGAKVLLIDMDQQANLTEHCGIDLDNAICMYEILNKKINVSDAIINVGEGVDLLPSKIDNAALDDFILFNNLSLDRIYKDIFTPLTSEYDLILIDCPPALGRSVGAISLTSDYIISPVTPDKQCIRGLKLLIDQLKQLESMPYGKKVEYKIVYNKYDGRTSLSRQILTALLKHEVYKNKLLDTYVRQNQEFANVNIKNISLYDSVKNTSAHEDIDYLTKEILQMVSLQYGEQHKITI